MRFLETSLSKLSLDKVDMSLSSMGLKIWCSLTILVGVGHVLLLKMESLVNETSFDSS